MYRKTVETPVDWPGKQASSVHGYWTKNTISHRQKHHKKLKRTEQASNQPASTSTYILYSRDLVGDETMTRRRRPAGAAEAHRSITWAPKAAGASPCPPCRRRPPRAARRCRRRGCGRGRAGYPQLLAGVARQRTQRRRELPPALAPAAHGESTTAFSLALLAMLSSSCCSSSVRSLLSPSHLT